MTILKLGINKDDRAALEQAVAVLEQTNWIIRLAGKPVEMIGNLTPKAFTKGESVNWEFNIISLKGMRRHMEAHAVPLAMPTAP